MRSAYGTRVILLLVVAAGFLEGGEGRREKERAGGLNVRLEIPKYPKVGDRVILGCKYDLGTDTLYTVKWYKGNAEFYRFTPKEAPSVKIFEFPGEVDRSHSNATQLALKRVDLNMSGKYSCEVTTDAPDFTTDLKSESLNVVAFTNSKPSIGHHKSRYAVGDTIDVSCNSLRSRPATNLTWLINSTPANLLDVHLSRTEKKLELDQTFSSRSNLILHLIPQHFINGRLSLTCTASIYDRYSSSSEVLILEDDRPKISSVVDNSSSSSQSHSSSRSGHGRSEALRLSSMILIVVLGGLWH